DTLTLQLADVVPSLAGPKRPQDRVPLTGVRAAFLNVLSQSLGPKSSEEAKLESEGGGQTAVGSDEHAGAVPLEIDGVQHVLNHGDVVIAAITSCTNTPDQSVMLAAGLLARNAVARGLQRKPWVKTSLAPGSKVVTDYLAKAGLDDDLDQLGFDLVGYGCTTCIGNSG